MADMIPIDFGSLIEEQRRRKEKEKIIGGYNINESAISDFADPNYKPKSILDQFADPEYVPESIQDRIAKEVPLEQQLSVGDLILRSKAKDSKQSRDAKALTKYAEDLNKKDKAEKPTFVEKDTVLGRMFDKRIRPGAETSSRNKMFTYMDEIGKNLVERRVKGDKSSTLDRVLGGVIEGKDAVITKDKDKVAQRLENIMIDQKVRKEEATIAKLQAEVALESYGYNVKDMDNNTKEAHFEVLSRLGSDSIGTGPYQIALNEILTSNKSRDMLKNMEGYSNILQVLSQEQEGSDAYNNAQAIKNEYERVMGIESMDSSSATSSKEYTE